MAKTSRYCSAYQVPRLRAFPGWVTPEKNTHPELDENGKKKKEPRVLGEKDYLFVHDSYVVTDGTYLDEHVVWKDITPEWVEFCETQLNFKVPDDILAMMKKDEERAV